MSLKLKAYSDKRTCLGCGKDLRDDEEELCNSCNKKGLFKPRKISFDEHKTDLSSGEGHKISLASDKPTYPGGHSVPQGGQTNYYSNNTVERAMAVRSNGFIPFLILIIATLAFLTFPSSPYYNPEFTNLIHGLLSGASNIWSNNNTTHTLTISWK